MNWLKKLLGSRRSENNTGTIVNIGAGTISINGVTYSGKNIIINDDSITIDGKEQHDRVPKNIPVKILNDAHVNIISNHSVSAQNITGNVVSNGSVNADDIHGNVEAKGSVNCDDIYGFVKAGGSINADEILSG